MSEQSFTPGEWRVEQSGLPELRNVSIYVVSGDRETGVLICEVNTTRTDAALLAAAPALMKALKALIPTNVGNPAASIPDDQVLPVDMTVGELRKALAAISQAEGRDHG